MHQTGSKFTHADLHMTRVQKDHADTESLTDILEHGWINPMSGDQTDLVSISTGSLAPPPNIANGI